jgi:flagellar motor switch protein FliN
MTALPGGDSNTPVKAGEDLSENADMRTNRETEANAADTVQGSGTLGFLLDMELPVVVRFGRTRMLLRDLLQVNAGSVIALDPAPQNAVELLVNGRLIARGLAVSVHGNYAVRVSEIAAARESFASELGLGNAAAAEARED